MLEPDGKQPKALSPQPYNLSLNIDASFFADDDVCREFVAIARDLGQQLIVPLAVYEKFQRLGLLEET